MSEKIQEQISAFLDGELPENEAELLTRRLSRDGQMRRKAVNYRMIGAAMRGDLLHPDPDVLRERIATALGGEPAARHAPERRGWAVGRWARPALGLGVAATVAVVALLGLQTIARQNTGVPATPLVAGVDQLTAPRYVVPSEPLDTGLVQVPIRLTNYLVNHGEYATSLGRKSIHSDIVGYQVNADGDEVAPGRDPR